MQNKLRATVDLHHKPLAAALIRARIYYHVFLSTKFVGGCD